MPRFCAIIIIFCRISSLPAQVPVISWTVTPNDTVCDGATIHMLESASNGPIGASSFTFTTPSTGGVGVAGTVSGAGTNVNLTFFGDGVYTFCASATNSYGTGSGCYTIVVLPTYSSISISASPSNPVCAGQPISFTATPVNGGANPTYQWQVNGVNVGTNSPYFSSSTLSNNDIVSVSMHINSICASDPEYPATYQVHITQPHAPSVSISPNPVTTCAGGNVTFTASPSFGGANPGYQWNVNGNNTGGNSSTFTLTNPSQGDQVSVVMTSNAPCLLSNNAADTVIVNINPFSISPGNSYTVCSGNSIQLSVTEGSSWNWLPSSDLNCANCQDPVASPSSTTVYTVVTSQLGCTASTTDTIVVIPTASAVFTTSVITAGLPQSISFQNNSQNATAYQWNFGDQTFSIVTSPYHTYSSQGDYPIVLIAYGNNGCNDTTMFDLAVNDTIGIVIPNIFTPNGDAINDVFMINVHGFTSKSLAIFDRWGLKIFESNNQAAWDGRTTAGVPCSEGTYYYVFTGTDFRNTPQIRKGWIQLNR